MLLKYAGISFISGAVSHGVFSGTRSVLTAATGMLLFVLGAWLDHRLASRTPGAAPVSLLRTLFWGALLSVGVGCFTGGLQHFPDSPWRSAWVVPLGFVLSVVALAVSNDQPWKRSASVYALTLGAAVFAFSWGAYTWLTAHPGWGGGHGHAASPGLVAQTVTRTVAVHMDDTMRFNPDRLEVKAGETIRFVVTNAGQLPHELVLGNEKELAVHAEEMRRMATVPTDHAHQHGGGAALTVAPGQTGELVVTFAQAGTVHMACLVPGHFEAGMRGQIAISGEGAAPHAAGHGH